MKAFRWEQKIAIVQCPHCNGEGRVRGMPIGIKVGMKVQYTCMKKDCRYKGRQLLEVLDVHGGRERID
jgi:DnaJ-class molecular chaperone